MAALIKNNLILELHVPDLGVVKDFYSKIGFQVRVEDKPNEKDPGYLTMVRSDSLGNTLLNFYGGDDRVFNQSYFKQFPKDTKRGYATEITIPTGDIDSVYAAAVKHLQPFIVRELTDLEDHDFKWRDFRMVDPYGFYLRFTELVDWGQD